MLERLIFGSRPLIIVVCAVLTVFLGSQALNLRPGASFEDMIPSEHPYMQNLAAHKADIGAQSNVMRIIVESKSGDIFNEDYLAKLKEITDEVFFIPGVDRGNLKSLWTPNVRWATVTEEGFAGGIVIPDDYDGSQESLDQVRTNVLRSGQLGALVANNFESAIVLVPLNENHPDTGERLDYGELSRILEERVRDKFNSDTINIRITGSAKVIGDMIEAAVDVAMFFAVATAVTIVLLYIYTRSIRSTIFAAMCSLLAVVWQLGILSIAGYELDPYSILVPFLVFAIGVSHAVQMVNAIINETTKGFGRLESARNAFRELVAPGIAALFSDSLGFLALLIISIVVIQNLALSAGIGVAMVVLSNLVLLPVILSYTGVRKRKQPDADGESKRHRMWQRLAVFSRPRGAYPILAASVALAIVGGIKSLDLKIGDLDPGAPELHADSRYNLDVAFLAENFSTSTDILLVMVKTEENKCSAYEALRLMDDLQWRLENTEGVQSTSSLTDAVKGGIQALNEGNLKWYALNRNRLTTNAALVRAPRDFFNVKCSLAPIIVNLTDHKADTLERVVAEVEAFDATESAEGVEVLLAAGNAGVEAATNIVVEQEQYTMLILIYSVVAVLVYITFRSFKSLIYILLPLAFTSLLAQALMAQMGIGVKIATMPVIALGVGIGVDYGLYLYSRFVEFQNRGESVPEAFANALRTTGHAIAFTGIALALAVGTWVFSPLKFQADMGALLTFMFLWNMLGALVVAPALIQLLEGRSGAKASKEEPLAEPR